MITKQTPGREDQSNTPYVILISCIATIGGFLFGFDSGVINGTVEGLQTAFDSDSVGTGFNVASMLLGCAIGALFAGRLADQHGRRFIMRAAAIFFIVSAWNSDPVGREGQALRWVKKDSLDADELLPADAPVVDALRQNH